TEELFSIFSAVKNAFSLREKEKRMAMLNVAETGQVLYKILCMRTAMSSGVFPLREGWYCRG
ncbi:MAG: hypothetical protein IJC58_04920, partial [Oscillospiraceae bacterium]|nr:hypothetical protein [Oscillospiraceae bacterium]